MKPTRARNRRALAEPITDHLATHRVASFTQRVPFSRTSRAGTHSTAKPHSGLWRLDSELIHRHFSFSVGRGTAAADIRAVLVNRNIRQRVARANPHALFTSFESRLV